MGGEGEEEGGDDEEEDTGEMMKRECCCLQKPTWRFHYNNNWSLSQRSVDLSREMTISVTPLTLLARKGLCGL